MRNRVRRSAIIFGLVALMVVLWAASASAMSATNQQVTPGMTTRTIWDSSQVAVYKLPDGINHNGYMHFELTWRPGWADLDIYLLDKDWSTLSEEMGYMAMFTGKEVIDYKVTNVANRTIETDPYTLEQTMVGDPYYVVVVAFNDAAKYQLRGYYPQIDLEVATSTTNAWNYYIQSWRMPAAKDAYKKIAGPIYGYPYDFKPTSEGDALFELEWPADEASMTVDPAIKNGLMPANLEQYVYAGLDWNSTTVDNYGDGNWWPPALGGDRYGLTDTLAIAEGEYAAPNVTLHYVPSVFLIASDWAQGPFAEPKLGTQRMGYKATLTYPENLRLVTWTKTVWLGSKATMRGTFALDDAWAPAGTIITIQKKAASGWVKVKTTKVGTDGKWVAKFAPKATATYRAMAAGNDLTGLATELSVAKKIRVRR